jgi:hypothetical protein
MHLTVTGCNLWKDRIDFYVLIPLYLKISCILEMTDLYYRSFLDEWRQVVIKMEGIISFNFIQFILI